MAFARLAFPAYLGFVAMILSAASLPFLSDKPLWQYSAGVVGIVCAIYLGYWVAINCTTFVKRAKNYEPMFATIELLDQQVALLTAENFKNESELERAEHAISLSAERLTALDAQHRQLEAMISLLTPAVPSVSPVSVRIIHGKLEIVIRLPKRVALDLGDEVHVHDRITLEFIGRLIVNEIEVQSNSYRCEVKSSVKCPWWEEVAFHAALDQEFPNGALLSLPINYDDRLGDPT